MTWVVMLPCHVVPHGMAMCSSRPTGAPLMAYYRFANDALLRDGVRVISMKDHLMANRDVTQSLTTV